MYALAVPYDFVFARDNLLADNTHPISSRHIVLCIHVSPEYPRLVKLQVAERTFMRRLQRPLLTLGELNAAISVIYRIVSVG